jgi:hypothetical protein
MSVLDEIKVTHLPKIRHRDPLYRDGWVSFMLCGKSGCGKTSLMAQLVPGMSECIRFIVIATQNYNNPFHIAIKKWAAEHNKVCVISTSPDQIRTFMTTLHRAGWLIPGKQEALIIFDDFSIDKRSGRRIESFVVEAYTRWRNMGVNFVIVCQDAGMIATSCRNCTNMRALFNSASRTALATFNKDIIDRVADPEVYKGLVRYVTSVPFSYLLIRENPLDLAIGKGTALRKVMSDTDVVVPTYQELMSELGVNTPKELSILTKGLQRHLGNTAPELLQVQDRRSLLKVADSPEDESDNESGSDEEWTEIRR